MATFNYRIDNFYLQGFTSSWTGTHATRLLPVSSYNSSSYASQNYSAIIKYGDTVNLTVGYGGQGTLVGDVINYLYYPYSTSNLGYPQPSSTSSSNPATTNGGAIPSKTYSRTWSGYSDYYAHWYFYNGSTANSNAARNQFRILAIPTSTTHMAGNGDNSNTSIMRISSIQASIIRGTGTGNANIDVPTAFLPYINSTFQGSYFMDQVGSGYHSENLYGADGSYGGTGELFSWYIYNSNGTLASTSYFSARDGTINGNQFNNSGRYVLSISPTASCPLGTYYLELHHWDTTPEYPSSGSGTGAIFSPTSSNTRIARRQFTVTDPVRITNVTLSGSTSTSSNANVVVRDSWTEPLQVTYVHRVNSSDQTGFEGTIYYTLPSPLSTYGWSASTYVEFQSGWLARTYTSTIGQTYKYMTETQGQTDAVNSNGITLGSSQTYYVIATDGNSQNVADTGQTYQVDRPRTSVTLVASGTGVTSNSNIDTYHTHYNVPSTTTSVTVPVQNNGNTTHYILREGSTSGTSVGIFAGNGVNTSGFTVSGSELPTAGNYQDYYCLAKINTSNGGLDTYIDTLRRIRLTRQAAVPTYSVSPAASTVDEGSSLVFNVTTTNVSDNTTLYYTINHGTTSNADFSSASGSFTITNNSGSFTLSPTADSAETSNETFSAQVRTSSTSGSVVATSSTVTINNTYPATGGGTTSNLDITASANYGLQIRNSLNQVIFDPSVRNTRTTGQTFSVSLTAKGSGTSHIHNETVSGVTASNSDEIVIVGGYGFGGLAIGGPLVVTRSTNTITITNNSTVLGFSGTFEVFRVG